MLTVDYEDLGLEPGELILDMGAGAGRHAFESLRRGGRIIALDYSYDELKSVRDLFWAMGEAGEVGAGGGAMAVRGDALRLPFADDTFDRIICSEVLEHIGDDIGAIAELTRVLKPGGTIAVTVPAFLPEKLCWWLSAEYHAPLAEGGHVRIYTEGLLRSRLAAAGLATGGSHRAHALHAPYWWLRCLVGPTNDQNALVKAYHRLLVWDIAKAPFVTRFAERALNPVLGKSVVVYSTKPGASGAAGNGTTMPEGKKERAVWLRDIEGTAGTIVTAESLSRTVDHIADIQLDSGMVPWFPGGHADPWNHCEALMALALGGRRADAERGFDWLRSKQHDDGSWHQYYLADRVEQDKLDANCVGYVAAAAWHHWLLFGDRGFLETMWPTVDAAIEFVLELQTPRGEILWARHGDGTPWSFALLTGSSSLCHSLRCAVAVAETLGHERPDWELSAARLARVIREEPDAFAPKHRWAMDWYYPVLAGVITGDDGRARLAERFDAFVMEGKGVRCVSDRPWVTAAETCEAMLAHLAVGETDRARQLFEWAQTLREPDGKYWTGIVYPEEVHFPGEEQSTYTAAAVVLAADALAGGSPASALFVDHDRLPALIDTHTDAAPASRDRSE